MFKRTATIVWSIMTVILLAVITSLKDFHLRPWMVVAIIAFGIGMALSAIALSLTATSTAKSPVEKTSRFFVYAGAIIFVYCLASIATHTLVYNEGSNIFADISTRDAAPVTDSASTAPANSDEYHWGWEKKETKILKTNYCVAGDVTVEGIEYFDDGGVNEATVVVNNSSRGLSVYSEFGAGEFTFAEKAKSITQIVRDEFATGGDPDAKTVRIVVVTDDGIEQIWYNAKLEIIKAK